MFVSVWSQYRTGPTHWEHAPLHPETLQLPTLTVRNVSARGHVIFSRHLVDTEYFSPCLFLIASPNMEAGMSLALFRLRCSATSMQIERYGFQEV